MNLRIFVLLAFLFGGVVGVSGALTDNITFSYTFDNSDTSGTTAIDSAGVRNATLVNSVTTGATGKIGEAYTFGSTKYVVANSNPYSANIEQMTIAAWVKPSSLPASLMDIISTEDIAPGNGFTLRWNTDKLNFFRHTGGSASATTESSINPLTAGTWSFLVVTFDSGNATIYVDDVQVGSSTSGTYIEYGTANPPVIGNFGDTAAAPFPRAWLGEIDDITVYNTALSRSQLTELYNSGDGLQYPFSPPPANTTFVTLTAVDAYDGSALNSFDATAYLGSNFDISTVGSVNTYTFDNEVGYLSVKVDTDAAFVIPYPDFCDATVQSVRLGPGSSGTYLECEQSGSNWYRITEFDDYAVSIQGLYNYDSYSTTNGTIITTIDKDLEINGTTTGGGVTTVPYVLFLTDATNYFKNLTSPILVSAETTEASIAQGFVSWTCSELYTESALDCAQGELLPRKVGSYTDSVNVTDYFPVSLAYNVSALDIQQVFSHDDNWDDPELLNDGDFDTSTRPSTAGVDAYAYWNYSYVGSALFAFKGSTAGYQTAFLPNECLKPGLIEIRVISTLPDGVGFGYVNWECYTGYEWVLIDYSGLGNSQVYEQWYAESTPATSVEGFFDYNLTISADDYAGNPESNFNITLENDDLGISFDDTASGTSITYSLLSPYTYAVVLNATSTIYGDPVNQIGYANISIEGTPPASESYQFNLTAARPVSITLYYEENLTLFENPANITLTPLSDSSTVYFETSTSNGTATIYNIPVAEYRIRVTSIGYHDEDRFFILSTYTGQNITAYFRENTTGSNKDFNVVDERNLLQNGWIIRFQRYYNDTGWVTVDEARSNVDGLAVENVLSDEYYRLILLNEGLVEEYRSDRTLLIQDTYQISSDVDTITNTQINKVLGVSAIVYMYPNLDRVEAIGTSSSGTRDWKLELYRTYTDGPVLINSTTGSGDSVNLSLYLPNATGDYYSVLSVLGSEVPVASNSVFIGGGPAAIGVSGAFYSFVLLLGIVGLAVFSAPAAIVLSIFAVIIASITGLFYVGLNAIVGLAIVGGMIIFRRNT